MIPCNSVPEDPIYVANKGEKVAPGIPAIGFRAIFFFFTSEGSFTHFGSIMELEFL